MTKGFEHLTGAMGILVQPRTKGSGHGSTSRAFYARTQFVAEILGIEMSNKALHQTAIPLRSIAAGELGRWADGLKVVGP